MENVRERRLEIELENENVGVAVVAAHWIRERPVARIESVYGNRLRPESGSKLIAKVLLTS